MQCGRDTILIRFLLHPAASPRPLLLLLLHYLHIDQLPMQGGPTTAAAAAAAETEDCCCHDCWERDADGCFRSETEREKAWTVGYCPQHSRGKTQQAGG